MFSCELLHVFVSFHAQITNLLCVACSAMSWFFREVVSLSTKTYNVPELDLKLDLAYITPRLIVCSGPVSSYRKSWYRYTTTTLIEFLNHRHVQDGEKHWHVYNFRGEGMGYTLGEFDYRVDYIPFPDHQVPPMDVVIDSIGKIEEFLSADPLNVAVLHCKAGKGRSGTIACAYILYKSLEKELIDPQEAIGIFTSQRMNQYFGDGVSILSQRRYLNYWHQLLLERRVTNRILVPFARQKLITISRVVIDDVRTPFNLRLETYNKTSKGRGVAGTTELFNMHVSLSEASTVTVPINIDVHLTQDVRVHISDACSAWFCPYFEKEPFSVDWHSCDGYMGTHFRGKQVFQRLKVCWSVE